MTILENNRGRPKSLTLFVWSFLAFLCINALVFGLLEGLESGVRSFLAMAILGTGVYGTFKGVNVLRVALLSFLYILAGFTWYGYVILQYEVAGVSDLLYLGQSFVAVAAIAYLHYIGRFTYFRGTR
jgi:hypothetical protein